MKKVLFAATASLFLLGAALGSAGPAFAVSADEAAAEAKAKDALAAAEAAAEKGRAMQQLKEQAAYEKAQMEQIDAEDARRAGTKTD